MYEYQIFGIESFNVNGNIYHVIKSKPEITNSTDETIIDVSDIDIVLAKFAINNVSELIGKTFKNEKSSFRGAFENYVFSVELKNTDEFLHIVIYHLIKKTPIDYRKYDNTIVYDWIEGYWNNSMITKKSEWIFNIDKWIDHLNFIIKEVSNGEIWLESNDIDNSKIKCKGQAGYFVIKSINGDKPIECILTFGFKPILINNP
jgi:hypothetical protein